MTEISARHGLPLLVSGQGQKDITHNEALTLLDGLVSAVAESRTLGVPPVAPGDGACWLISAPSSGFWAGRAGELAIWTAGGWRFARIPEGMLFYLKDEAVEVRKLGTGWQVRAPKGAPAAALSQPNGGAVIDLEARAAIAAIAVRLQQLGLVAA